MAVQPPEVAGMAKKLSLSPHQRRTDHRTCFLSSSVIRGRLKGHLFLDARALSALLACAGLFRVHCSKFSFSITLIVLKFVLIWF